MDEQISPKRYNRTWLSITLGLLIFPFGLYGLWKNQRLKNVWKILISVLSPFTTVLAGFLVYVSIEVIFFRDKIQFDSATIKYDHKDYLGAIAEYDSALKINPAYAKAYLMRGNAYEELGDKQKAIIDFTLAIQFDSTYTEAYYNRGLIKIKQKNFKEAFVDFNDAIKHDSTHSDSYVERGNVKFHLNGYTIDDGIADFDKAIKFEPTNITAYANRGLAKMDKWMTKEAIADFDQAILLSYEPKGAFFYYRGLAKIRLHQNKEACKDFNTGLKLGDSKSPEALKSYCQ